MTMRARAGRGGGGRSPSSLNPPPLDSSAGKRAPPSGCAASEGGLASAQVKLDGRRSCAIHPPRRRVFFFFFWRETAACGGTGATPYTPPRRKAGVPRWTPRGRAGQSAPERPAGEVGRPARTALPGLFSLCLCALGPRLWPAGSAGGVEARGACSQPAARASSRQPPTSPLPACHSEPPSSPFEGAASAPHSPPSASRVHRVPDRDGLCAPPCLAAGHAQPPPACPPGRPPALLFARLPALPAGVPPGRRGREEEGCQP